MVKVVNKDDAADPLGDLAAEASGKAPPLGDGVTDLDVAHQAHQAADEEAMAAALKGMQAGVQMLVMGLLRATRARLARSLPEINDEWTDEVLAGPAAAAVPVVNRYAQQLMPLLGQHPELAALMLALLPLPMGYMAAIDRHRAAIVQAAPQQ